MSRRSLLLLFVASALGLASCGGSGSRPDVVLVVVDTLRADRLSCYGYERPTTPELDGFAASGVRFADATAQAPWTLPSMVSLLTGRYVDASASIVDADETTLGLAFQRAGYATVAVVGNPVLTVKPGGFASGFDQYVVLRRSEDKRVLERTDGDPVAAGVFEKLEALPRGDAPGRAPLFLWAHLYAPHGPYQRYRPLDAELPAAGADPVMPAGWRERVLAERGPAAPPDDPHWEAKLAEIDRKRGLYDHEVRATDITVRRLVDGLAERGYGANAIFAFVSDHGEGLWEHVANITPDEETFGLPTGFFYRKHGAQLYAEAIETPFLLWGAGVPAGVVVTEPVENVDLYPTLLELAGLALPGGVHGRSLVPLLHGNPESARTMVFSTGRSSHCVREAATGLKLSLPADDERAVLYEPELYDRSADPHERSNLYATRPDDVRRLREALEAWIALHDVGRGGEIDPDQWELLEGLGYTEADIGR